MSGTCPVITVLLNGGPWHNTKAMVGVGVAYLLAPGGRYVRRTERVFDWEPLP